MGRASVKKLNDTDVFTVADFVAMSPDLVRDMLTVTGMRTHAELRGIQHNLIRASVPPVCIEIVEKYLCLLSVF